MTLFIQAHFLTSYPPSNLNRDDLGRPKITSMGGVNRLRISSQSLKRAWRTSDLFEEALADHIGKRTKKIGRIVFQKFIENGITDKDATFWTKKIISVFGKNDSNADKTKKDKLSEFDINQLVHISNEEKRRIDLLINKCSIEQKAPMDEDLNLLCKEKTSVDIACFGRMLADESSFNVHAAIQVAHAVTTHSVDIEDDYFTAVDDLNNECDAGAAHLGQSEYACGLFYHYLCINYDLLKDNLDGNDELSKKTLSALIESAAKVSPTGKQNSFASRAYTSYMLVEKGSQQPRSLTTAFLRPVLERDILLSSIKALEEYHDNINKVYGSCFDSCEKFNVIEGKGTLDNLIKFCISE